MRRADINVIQLTRQQVYDAAYSLVDAIQCEQKGESAQMDVANALGSYFERTLLKDNVVPRIKGCIDLDWLHANRISYAIKSSVGQFLDGTLRIHIGNMEQRAKWIAWRTDDQ